MQQVDYNIVSRLLGELGNLDCSTSELATLLAALVEHSPVPLWIYAADDSIVYNNRASCRFGTGNNVVGSHLDTWSPQVRELLWQGLSGCRTTGEACFKAGWINSPVIGERYLHFDFLPLPGGMTACLSHDLTESERAKAALCASEERVRFFANMLERTPVPFCTAYHDGRIMLANQAFCELTGYAEVELRELNLFEDLASGDTREAEAQAQLELRATGAPQRYEKVIPRRDGSRAPVEIFIQQLLDEQAGVQHYSLFAIDISRRRKAADALREHEERFRYVAELATDGIWDWRIGSEEEYLSPRLKHMLGYADDELPNRADTWEKLIHPDDLALAKQAYHDHLHHGAPFLFLARYFRKDGSMIWVSCRGQALQDASGAYYRVVGTHTDVTERKLAEEALRESEQRLALALEGAADGIWDYDAITHSIYSSPQLAARLGYDPADPTLDYAAWAAFVHPDDRPKLLAAWQSHLAGATKHFGCEHRLRTADGEYVWMLNSGKVVERDAQGRPLRAVGTLKDITERKLAEQALHRSEEFLEAVLDSAPLGISVRTNTGRLIRYNAAWQKIWALPPEDITQDMTCERENLVLDRRDDYSRPWWSEIQRVYSVGGTLHIPRARTLGRRQGAAGWVSQYFYAIPDELGRVDRVVVLTQDVTEAVSAEASLRDSEERLRLYSEQLRALMGRLETVQESERTRIAREVHDELGQNLTSIKMDLRWMERMLEKGLAATDMDAMLARMAGAVGLADATMSAVQRLCSELRPSVLDKLGLGPALQFEARMLEQRTGIACLVSLPPALPPLAPELVTTCFRICQECLTNVVRHAGATRVAIELLAEQAALRLRIRDNGKGINDAALADPHSLGLLGMKERAALLGGCVSIQCARDGGTVVEVAVPLPAQESKHDSHTAHRRSSDSAPGT
jgi:PAS domain S-box-containing protein